MQRPFQIQPIALPKMILPRGVADKGGNESDETANPTPEMEKKP